MRVNPMKALTFFSRSTATTRCTTGARRAGWPRSRTLNADFSETFE